MHVVKNMQEMLNRPARSSASAGGSQSKASDQSHVSSSAENKGSGDSASPNMTSQQECQNGGAKDSSSEKRERESPDTTTKPEGKSLKTSGASSSEQPTTPEQGTHAEDVSDKSNPDQESVAMQGVTIRRAARTRDEAKLQVMGMHRRTPAWKLPKCIKVVNRQPLDLDCIAEVTEIQFASTELVEVTAKCLKYADEAASRQRLVSVCKAWPKASPRMPSLKLWTLKTPKRHLSRRLMKMVRANLPKLLLRRTRKMQQHQVLLLGNVPQHSAVFII